MGKGGGIEFNHFEFVTQQQCDKIIQDTPKKYEKKIVASTFLREQNSTDSSTVESTKNYGVKKGNMYDVDWFPVSKLQNFITFLNLK